MRQGAMLVNVATGACFQLNDVAGELWTLTNRGMTIGEAAASVAARYDVFLSTVEEDAISLFSKLLAAGLVLSESSCDAARS